MAFLPILETTPGDGQIFVESLLFKSGLLPWASRARKRAGRIERAGAAEPLSCVYIPVARSRRITPRHKLTVLTGWGKIPEKFPGKGMIIIF